MQHTSIEWVRNPDGSPGYTFNPITGCLNGCPYCYARKLANGRLKERYLVNGNIAPPDEQYLIGFNTEYNPSQDPFYPRFWEEKLNISHTRHFLRLPDRQRYKDRGIFVCDMSDLFGIGIPEEWTSAVIEEIKLCSNDRFYLLTKQPQNLIKFSPFPDNCYVGVTVTNKLMYADALKYLGNVGAAIHFLSFEPLLSWDDCLPKADGGIMLDHQIDWLIIGTQTKPYKPPKIEWVTEIVRAADRAGVPVFIKDNLRPLVSVELDNKFLTPNTPNLIFHRWGKMECGAETQILRQEIPAR